MKLEGFVTSPGDGDLVRWGFAERNGRLAELFVFSTPAVWKHRKITFLITSRNPDSFL